MPFGLFSNMHNNFGSIDSFFLFFRFSLFCYFIFASQVCVCVYSMHCGRTSTDIDCHRASVYVIEYSHGLYSIDSGSGNGYSGLWFLSVLIHLKLIVNRGKEKDYLKTMGLNLPESIPESDHVFFTLNFV